MSSKPPYNEIIVNTREMIASGELDIKKAKKLNNILIRILNKQKGYASVWEKGEKVLDSLLFFNKIGEGLELLVDVFKRSVK